MTQLFESDRRAGRFAELQPSHAASTQDLDGVADGSDPRSGHGVNGSAPLSLGVERERERASLIDARTGLASRVIRNLAVQDAVVATYFVVMFFALAFGTGTGREASMQTVLADLACCITGIVITRGGLLRPGAFANALVYRLSVFLPVFLSYFQLKHIAPAVTSKALDADLVAFDLRVFGVEPSLAWDRYVTPHTTEWFAFFYFGYFFLLCAHVLPMMLNASSRFRLAHFSLGIIMVCVLGHLGYLLVPGWGPYKHLEGHFQHPLEGGLFWGLVKATVEAGGSQKDIFPSLHTAMPTYFAIFSYIHRRAFPFRYTWPILAFSATQIIGATMFLRWHYLVDIIAGIALATTAALASHRIVTWESARREIRGLAPIYSLLPWPRPATSVTRRRGSNPEAEGEHALDGSDDEDSAR